MFPGRGGNNDSNSDEEFMDNASVYSTQSDNAGSVDEATEDTPNSSERYEEKLMIALENATEKSAQTRVQALESIGEVLMHCFMPDYVDDRKITILDVIEKAIRRGKGDEQAWGAKLATLLAMQLGGGELIAKSLSSFLLTTAQDKSVTFNARAKCCKALALLNFLGNDDIGDIMQLMQHFEVMFSGSYLKGDLTPSAASADAAILHSAALSSWGLLLTLIPAGDFVTLMLSQKISPSIANLMGMLQSPHLEVRMTAGETIALVLECGRSHDDDFLEEDLPDLTEATKKLATDSNKFRAKRDRKTQRATFRDVLRYLEEDISPEINIRFGVKESLILDNWALHHQYTTLCSAMGSGMNVHLAENDFLRDILQLGDKPILNDPLAPGYKQGKLVRVSFFYKINFEFFLIFVFFTAFDECGCI